MAKRWLVLVTLLAVTLVAGPARAQDQKQQILAAVQAAFTAWEQVACTNLHFEYKGELDPFVPEKDGAIVVYFGDDNLTWTGGSNAYYTTSTIGLVAEGNITKASIGMNARDFKWSIGASENHIDIQTAVMHMIPAAIGFYVGSDPKTGSLSDFIKYSFVDHTLTPEHITGAQYAYYSDTGQCARPEEPQDCLAAAQSVDAGVADSGGSDAAATDGGAPSNIQLCYYPSNPGNANSTYYHWTSIPIPYYVFIRSGQIPGGDFTPTGDQGTTPHNDGGSTTNDGGSTTGDGGTPQTCTTSDQCGDGKVCTAEGICVSSGGDDGCCRISHTREENIAYTFLLALGIGLFVWRRRRQKRR